MFIFFPLLDWLRPGARPRVGALASASSWRWRSASGFVLSAIRSAPRGTVSCRVLTLVLFHSLSANCSHQTRSPALSNGMGVALPGRRNMALYVCTCVGEERRHRRSDVPCIARFDHSSLSLSLWRRLAPLYLIFPSPSSQSAMALGASLGCSIICALARIVAISAMYVVSAKW